MDLPTMGEYDDSGSESSSSQHESVHKQPAQVKQAGNDEELDDVDPEFENIVEMFPQYDRESIRNFYEMSNRNGEGTIQYLIMQNNYDQDMQAQIAPAPKVSSAKPKDGDEKPSRKTLYANQTSAFNLQSQPQKSQADRRKEDKKKEIAPKPAKKGGLFSCFGGKRK
uniref:CUE domain-containing protein n=1 Tax=Euplotes harpa TaxID=151035 RepID=A0A7S3J095_9SPIT|mmetsp:Transcript_10069/g.11331  ORF Transcript_10069/g.11331 Transcript_10069/m.11331 type:complete len:167 (+) Transcript_10069:146-646(+)